MIKKLGWIAVGGIAVGIASLAGAYAAGGKDTWTWRGMHHWGSFMDAKCGKNIVSAENPETERRFAWNGGDEVSLAIPATIHYRVGEGDEVIVRAPADILEHVIVAESAIGLKCHGLKNVTIDVTLPGRAFREINLAGSGSMQAKGSVDRVEVAIAGSGDAKLAELAIKTLELSVAGSGDAEAAPTDTAEVSVMGSGNLTLFSHPKRLETNIMGSGRVIHAAAKSSGI